MTAATRAETVNVGYDQDVFWKDGEGIVHLIDGMDDRYRVNVCRFLIDKAAARHRRRRRWWYNWEQFMSVGYTEMPGDVMDEAMQLVDTPGWVDRQIRKEQDRGEHLDWMRSTALFRRMVHGVEHLVGPGVLAP